MKTGARLNSTQSRARAAKAKTGIKKLGAWIAASAILTTPACYAPKHDESKPEAISNRPQNYDRFIAILKLREPALLSTATRGADNKVVLDAALSQRIDAEQAALLAQLQQMSSEIQILYKYKMTLNGVAIIAPKALEAQFRQIASVSYVEGENPFTRLNPVNVSSEATAADQDIANHNSANFIGAGKIHTGLNLAGKGVKVGVIDTGIDYTHKMLGGAGTAAAYQAVAPSQPDAGFPNAKVVGGIDLVGTEYNSGSPNFAQHIPIADANPLDEAGHGTHVAGTIAGLGDGVQTYDGVAPEADLYAIKVFGKDGSTGDAVIIAALEYASDPNNDGDVNDHLDVVNLSLGSPFGTPHVLYTEAVNSLIRGGTVVVAAAGNEGPTPYIVGSPSTAQNAISVAATIDDMDHNWKFRAVRFATSSNPQIITEAIEAAISKPIAEAGDVSGPLVHLGLADQELTAAQKAAVAGRIAFIDRGGVTFATKLTRAAEAGAIGVVVANNTDGEPLVMGGEGSVAIPAIMINKALGDALKADLASNQVRIDFRTDQKVERPELVDTLTGFSSRGPRSIDGALKPEVAAPGSNIISAGMGEGDKAVRMSGTSMATPHVAGVVALLHQAHPELDAVQIKSLLMTTARQIHDASGQAYPVAYMGAGRVQAYEAATAQIIATPSALSLGEVQLEHDKQIKATLSFSNLTDEAVTLALSSELKAGITAQMPASLTLAAHATESFEVRFQLRTSDSHAAIIELDGFIVAQSSAQSGTQTHKVPVLAVINRSTRIETSRLNVLANSPANATGATAQLTLRNRGTTGGDAMLFNLLGQDERKEAARENIARNAICDLESAGYRIVKKVVDGQELELLQIAAKLYNPVTSWNVCEISIQIDADGDGIADQELLGTSLDTLTGNAKDVQSFASVLTNAGTMRSIRRNFELQFPSGDAAVYTPAIIDAQDLANYEHSTINVVSADLRKLARTAQGDLRIKVATLTDTGSPEADDFLANHGNQWASIVPTRQGMAFSDLPDTVHLNAGEHLDLSFTKGGADGQLVVYLPQNHSTQSDTLRDKQSVVLDGCYQ